MSVKLWGKWGSKIGWVWHNVSGYFIHYVAILTIGLIVVYFKSLRDDEQFVNYLRSAREWITPLTIAFLSVALFALLIFAVRQNGQLKHLRSHLAGFGVRVFSPHDSDEVRSNDWAQICKDLVFASRNQSPLWILCANGHRTFGHRDAPLCAALREYDGVINVLLLKPDSDGFNRRVKNLKIDAAAYRSEILDSIAFCKELFREGKAIHVRLYHDLPIWKMIFTPKALWVQHYSSAKRVDETSAYGFSFVESRPTLIDGFQCVLTRRWSDINSEPVNLDSFVKESYLALSADVSGLKLLNQTASSAMSPSDQT